MIVKKTPKHKIHRIKKKPSKKKFLWIQLGFLSILAISICFLWQRLPKTQVLGATTDCSVYGNGYFNVCQGSSICVTNYRSEPYTLNCSDGSVYQRNGTVYCGSYARYGVCYDWVAPTATPVPPTPTPVPPTATPRPQPTATPVPQQQIYWWNECRGCSCVNVSHSYSGGGNQCYPAGTNINNGCGCTSPQTSQSSQSSAPTDTPVPFATPLPTATQTPLQPTDTPIPSRQERQPTEIPTSNPTPTPTPLIEAPADTSNQPSNEDNNPISNFFNAVGNIIAPQSQQPQQTIPNPTPTRTQQQGSFVFPTTPTPTPIITVKVKRLDGTQIELSEDALVKMSQILQNENLPQIKRISGNNYAIIKNDIQAVTTFPLSIDLTNNTITVTTEGGERVIAITPDQAIQMVKNKKLANTITDQDGSQMQLVSLNGDPVFLIKGSSAKRVFNLFNAPINKTIYVSAETGIVVKVDETAVSQVFDALSNLKYR